MVECKNGRLGEGVGRGYCSCVEGQASDQLSLRAGDKADLCLLEHYLIHRFILQVVDTAL